MEIAFWRTGPEPKRASGHDKHSRYQISSLLLNFALDAKCHPLPISHICHWVPAATWAQTAEDLGDPFSGLSINIEHSEAAIAVAVSHPTVSLAILPDTAPFAGWLSGWLFGCLRGQVR